ncbi:right-handed parallel beta-helix repeat-containing protein [Photobacterium aphoticum]|uniref:right-handed parallel beta-helix repeat-containing protein n=1 Tax=Photobacterium aphoticum TaxID=754436 RepID=UPI000AED8291|nr:right-handed parallel beta-helix repeat-containing protein [Photobacterium aphoticum]
MHAFLKKYLLTCGILLNAILLVISIKGAAHVGSQVNNLGEFFHLSAQWIKPYSETSAQALLSFSERVTRAHYFEAPFEPSQWPTIGPQPSLQASSPTTSLTALSPSTATLTVDNPRALTLALRQVEPGQTIVIRDGHYALKGKRFNISKKPGTALLPIRLIAETRGNVTLALDSREGIVIDQPYWRIEGIHFIGTCHSHSRCDHALHIVGDADNTRIAHNTFYDFNAAIKVNKSGIQYPDQGLIEHNIFGNHQPRNTHYSVTPINVDHGNDWVVRKNIIHDFIKLGGNRVSYGAFMKGGVTGGIFEQNLVICNTSQQRYPGSQVGLSFGGGGMSQASRRDNANFEVSDTIMRNNIIMHCNDVGIYSQKAVDVTVHNNTLYNTAGIDVRFPVSTASVYNNILNGRIKARDDATLQSENNLISTYSFIRNNNGLNAIFSTPQNGIFSVTSPEALIDYAIEAKPTTQTLFDFCGHHIHQNTAYIGAIYQDAGCFR